MRPAANPENLRQVARNSGAEEMLRLPSGLGERFLERRQKSQVGQAVARLRHVAPGLADDIGPQAPTGDLRHLCRLDALPRLPDDGMAADRVIVPVAARALGFGATDPSVRQVFEMFGVAGDDCIWELF